MRFRTVDFAGPQVAPLLHSGFQVFRLLGFRILRLFGFRVLGFRVLGLAGFRI